MPLYRLGIMHFYNRGVKIDSRFHFARYRRGSNFAKLSHLKENIMPKQIEFDIEAKKKLRSGINQLAEAVGKTFGPKGRSVLIQVDGIPHLTKDGVSVAKKISLKDPQEDVGAQLVKEVAFKTAEQAGDGTTTATLLAQEIFNRSLKYVTAGAQAQEVKLGLEKGLHHFIEYLHSISKPVITPNQMEKVATISANGDEELGSLIREAYEKVGIHGVVNVKPASGLKSEVKVTEGMKINSGYLSAHFITDSKTMKVEYDDPLLLLTTHTLSTLRPLIPILNILAPTNRPLVIVAENVEGEALSALVLNLKKSIIKTVAVKAPGFGENKKELLEDLALLTGANVFDKDKGDQLEEIELNDLGAAGKVEISQNSTTVVDGKGSQEKIEERKQHILNLLDGRKDPGEMKKLKERLALISGGIALISLSAATEPEYQEKKDRAEDAIHATRAALEEGIVPGGGVTFIRGWENLRHLKGDNPDQDKGIEIFRSSLLRPAAQLAENGGKEGKLVIKETLEGTFDYGYNAAKNNFEKLMEGGVVDAAKVLRLAIENAVSVAGMMLTTHCVITELPDKRKSGI